MQPLWKTAWSFLKTLKMELSYDPIVPLLGIYPKKIKSLSQHDIYTLLFITALYTVAKIWKQPKCPWTDEWMQKCEILPFTTTQMNLEDIMLSEINQTQKDKYCVISLTCEILKKQNEQTKTLLVTESRRVVIRSKGVEEKGRY